MSRRIGQLSQQQKFYPLGELVNQAYLAKQWILFEGSQFPLHPDGYEDLIRAILSQNNQAIATQTINALKNLLVNLPLRTAFIAPLERLLHDYPDWHELINFLAILYMAEGQYQRVGEFIQKSRQSYPSSALLIELLGCWYFYQGDYRQAVYHMARDPKFYLDELAREADYTPLPFAGEPLPPVQGSENYLFNIGNSSIGDNLMFWRYMRTPYQQGWGMGFMFNQHYGMNKPLAGYGERLFPGFQSIFSNEMAISSKDRVTSHIELMLLWEGPLHHIPPPEPLPTLPSERQYWAEWLAHHDYDINNPLRPLIAVSPSGMAINTNDYLRHIPLSWLDELIGDLAIVLLLNTTLGEDDKIWLDAHPHILAPLLEPRKEPYSLIDTASLLSFCDLTISTDTMLAHLSASVLKETWVTLYEPTEYRWGQHPNMTPFYPTMRLFRQPHHAPYTRGDWQPVFARLRQELTKRYAMKRPPEMGALDWAERLYQDGEALRALSTLTHDLSDKLRPATLEDRANSSPYALLPAEYADYLIKMGVYAASLGFAESARQWWQIIIKSYPEKPQALQARQYISLHSASLRALPKATKLEVNQQIHTVDLNETRQIMTKDEVEIPLNPHHLRDEIILSIYRGDDESALRKIKTYYQFFESQSHRTALVNLLEDLYEILPKQEKISGNLMLVSRIEGNYERALQVSIEALAHDPHNPRLEVESHFIQFYRFDYPLMVKQAYYGWVANQGVDYQPLTDEGPPIKEYQPSPSTEMSDDLQTIRLGSLGDFIKPLTGPLPPPPLGESESREFMLFCYGGLGDLLQAIRYLRCLEDRGWSIFILITSPQNLHAVTAYLKFLFPRVRLDHQLKGITSDYFCSWNTLINLGRADITKLIPPEPVTPPTHLREKWRNWLTKRRTEETQNKPLIAISISGDHLNHNDRFRRIELALLADLIQPFGTIILLNFDLRPDELEYWHRNPQIIAPYLEIEERQTITVMDSVVLLDEADLVISVDSFPAHLAGCQLRECWTLLYHPPEYRWGEAGSDYPWYPTMRLFRQKRRGTGVSADWQDVLADLNIALQDRYGLNQAGDSQEKDIAAPRGPKTYTQAISRLAHQLRQFPHPEGQEAESSPTSAPYYHLPAKALPLLAKMASLANQAGQVEMARQWWLILANHPDHAVTARLHLIEIEQARHAELAMMREIQILEASLNDERQLPIPEETLTRLVTILSNISDEAKLPIKTPILTLVTRVITKVKRLQITNDEYPTKPAD